MSVADRLHFDPAQGRVIREPLGSGYGYWAGGHKVFWDGERFALFYRLRTPLEHGRGGVARVAMSVDGEVFEDVWEVTKDELASSSIEVGHCVRHEDRWRLYISYEIAGTGVWRIDVIENADPADFDAQSRRTVLDPRDYGLARIKDPFLVPDDDHWKLFAAAPPRRTHVAGAHGRLPAQPLDATVLATSVDGLYFDALEYVFEAPGGSSWHSNRARLNSMFQVDGEWVATYDGGRTFYDNYEEWAGVATSEDGITFTRLPQSEPWVRSPYGSVRYVYGQRVGDQVLFYYEYTRSDGSHDLRVTRIDLS